MCDAPICHSVHDTEHHRFADLPELYVAAKTTARPHQPGPLCKVEVHVAIAIRFLHRFITGQCGGNCIFLLLPVDHHDSPTRRRLYEAAQRLGRAEYEFLAARIIARGCLPEW